MSVFWGSVHGSTVRPSDPVGGVWWTPLLMFVALLQTNCSSSLLSSSS